MFYDNLNNPNKQRITALYNDNSTLSKSDEEYLLSKAIEGMNGLQKADELGILSGNDINDFEKGRTGMPIGAHANWGGIDYLKTANGWKPAGKFRGHVKANHDHLHKNEDKDKDHHEMAMDAGKMEESEWTKKHGSTLHAKYKAVHDYLHKPKAEKKEVKSEEKTNIENPDEQKYFHHSVMNLATDGDEKDYHMKKVVELHPKITEGDEHDKRHEKFISDNVVGTDASKSFGEKLTDYAAKHKNEHLHKPKAEKKEAVKTEPVAEKKEEPKKEDFTEVVNKRISEFENKIKAGETSVKDVIAETKESRDKLINVPESHRNQFYNKTLAIKEGVIKHFDKSEIKKVVELKGEPTKIEDTTKEDHSATKDLKVDDFINFNSSEIALLKKAKERYGNKIDLDHINKLANKIALVDNSDRKLEHVAEAMSYEMEKDNPEFGKIALHDIDYGIENQNYSFPSLERLDDIGILPHETKKDISKAKKLFKDMHGLDKSSKALIKSFCNHQNYKSAKDKLTVLIGILKDAESMYSADKKLNKKTETPVIYVAQAISNTLTSQEGEGKLKKETPVKSKEDPLKEKINSIADKAVAQYNSANHVDKAKLKKRMEDAMIMHENGLKNNGKGLDETMVAAGKEFLKRIGGGESVEPKAEEKPVAVKNWGAFMYHKDRDRLPESIKRMNENEVRSLLANKESKLNHSMTSSNDKTRLRDEVHELRSVVAAHNEANEHNRSVNYNTDGHTVKDEVRQFKDNKEAKWVKVSHVDDKGVTRMSGQAIDLHGGDRHKAIEAGKESIKRDQFLESKNLDSKSLNNLSVAEKKQFNLEWINHKYGVKQ